MGFYNKGLQVDPSLVQLTGGIGKGFSAFGDGLVKLGDAKIAAAEKDRLEKEKKAKIKAIAEYNNYINPEAAKNASEDTKGLIQFTAPTYEKVSAGTSLVDPVTKKPVYTAPKAPTPKEDYTIDNVRFSGTTGKQIASVPKVEKPIEYVSQDGYKIREYPDGRTFRSKEKVKDYQQTAQETSGYVRPADLGISTAQAYELFNQGMGKRDTKGNIVIDKARYFKSLKEDPLGNYEEK